jgi:predicted pyridoxine 5'-phosphate oxidase superfamily flavin-nucleotide-binding protein
MKLTKKQVGLLNRRKIVVLASADLKAKPRAIFVEINKAEDDKIIITDNEMVTTRKNLLENRQVAILAFERDLKYCLKILGKAKYYTKGKYFDFVRKLEANKNRCPKGAIVITIKDIIEFK